MCNKIHDAYYHGEGRSDPQKSKKSSGMDCCLSVPRTHSHSFLSRTTIPFTFSVHLFQVKLTQPLGSRSKAYQSHNQAVHPSLGHISDFWSGHQAKIGQLRPINLILKFYLPHQGSGVSLMLNWILSCCETEALKGQLAEHENEGQLRRTGVEKWILRISFEFWNKVYLFICINH